MHHTVVRRGDTSIRAGEYTGIAAHAFILVDLDDTVLYRQRACNTAFDAQRLLAVAAGDGKADGFMLFNPDARVDGDIFQRLCHVVLAGIRERAVIFAEMAAQAPFFIDIDSFHSCPSLFAGMLDAEYVELLLRQADSPEHQTVATQGFDGIDAHAAHHFLDFVVPRRNEVYKALTPSIGV